MPFRFLLPVKAGAAMFSHETLSVSVNDDLCVLRGERAKAHLARNRTVNTMPKGAKRRPKHSR